MSGERRELRWIPIRTVVPGELPFAPEPFPPRGESEIADLMSSVRLHGVLCPVLVRVTDGAYQIVCGHRRYLAAVASGLSEIPAVVVDRMEDVEAIRCYLSENSLRNVMSIEAQGQALHLLKKLRDEPPGGHEDPSPLQEVGAERAVTPGRLERRLRGPGEQEVVSVETRQALVKARGGLLALRLFQRTEALLAQAQASRDLDVQTAEAIAEAILVMIDGGHGFDLRETFGKEGLDLTASHSILVAFLCARLSRSLGWAEAQVKDMALAGLLHDVGMVFLRGMNLAQARALTPSERVELHSHTRIGCALIAGTRAWNDDVAFCARDHHERWDGSGYPAGTIGADVSLPARLLGFIDTYAAMVTPRPHRNALQPRFACERLSKALELGLFDPALGSLLPQVLEDALVIAGRPGESSPNFEMRRNSVELEEEFATISSKDSA